MALRILLVLLSVEFFCLICHAEIVEERGSLLEFFAGSEEGCEYDNWVSHISEGIAREGYNDYGPAENDRQTNGFGAYQIVDSLENYEAILEDWYAIFANIISDQINEADNVLSNSAFADYYQIVSLADGDRDYILLREVLNDEYVDDNGTEEEDDDVTGSFDYGWGLYIFNTDPITEKVVFEIPHPCDDFITPFVGIDAFLSLNALAIFVTGAGREVEWTEEGEYNNALTRSDPTRLPNISVFQEAHKTIVDSVGSEFIIQIHSYDSGGRAFPQNILSAVLDRDPNPPILDFENKFDIISLTPLIPVAANTIGNADHAEVSIREYYSVYYDGGYFYNDTIQISNTMGGLQGWDSPQARYSHIDHNVSEDDENYFHVEHDEFPDVIVEEILEFFPADGVPTYQTYSYIVDYYRPLYSAIYDYYHKSRIHDVPDDFETIQTAINASFGGDTILVEPDEYIENINFMGKNLLLASHFLTTNDHKFIDQTIINGDQAGSVVTFDHGENANARLEGFTITNGESEIGGGIFCLLSDPTIDHCLIIGNSAGGVGGGIFYQGATSLITNCTISQNTAGESGGAIFGWDETAIGVLNCILWDNSPQEISFLRFGNPNLLNISYTDIDGGIEAIVLRNNAEIIAGDGIIDTDPLFAEPQSFNYFLEIDSPCIDAGDPEQPLYADSSYADMGALPIRSQDIHLSNDVLEFGDVRLGRLDSLGLTISNIGQSPLTVYSQTVIPEVTHFSIDEEEMVEFEIEGESEHVTWVRFIADDVDDYMAILQIISNDLANDSLYVRMTATAVTVIDESEHMAYKFGLDNLYPNPFNSTAIMTYTLPKPGRLKLVVYDIEGRLHKIVDDRVTDAGKHAVEINAVDFSAGVYFIKLEMGDKTDILKFVVVK